MARAPDLRVRLLGGLAIDGVDERELGSRKARTMLKLLAVARRQPVTIDHIADVLWPGEQPARPAEQVGVLASRLRAVVGQERLTRSDAGYTLSVDWLDVAELEARVAEASSALAAGRTTAARAAAGAALSLARGPLLPDDDGSWLEGERVAALALVARAREIAMAAATQAGDRGAAGVLAEQALAADPYDEQALRVLMHAHVAAGRPGSALASYARVRERLAEDLGVSPTSETDALHRRVLALHDAEPADAPVEVASAPTAVPRGLAGRDREFARLDAAMRTIADGKVVTVEVTGEAGIGKSALVTAWSAAAAARGATVLVGRCDELGRDLPLQPIADAVAGWLAGFSADDAAAALGAELAVVGPLFGYADSRATAATVVADPDVRRLALFAALLSVVLRVGGDGDTVLVIDDVHEANRSTLAWLAFANRRPGRLLIVTTARPAARRLLAAVHIELGPLDLTATAELVGAERAADLHRRSGGHPLFLLALANSASDELPADVEDAVHRWVSTISDAAPTVRAAAALGDEIDLDLLADALRVSAVEVLGHLEQAITAGLLVERDDGFAFRHAIVREALAHDLGSARRALVHRSAAEALVRRPGSDPLSVAVHARLGGDTALTVNSLVAASDVAADRHDLETAEALLDDALALQRSPAALAARARILMARFDLDRAAADASDALAAGGGAEALEVAAWVAYYQRRYDDAWRFADEGVARAADAGVRTSCLAVGGRARHGKGDLREGVRRLAEASGTDAPPVIRGVADVWLAHARLHQGRPAEALAAVDRALIDADRLAHPFAPLHGRFVRAMALGQLGLPVDGLVTCNDLDAAIERTGEVGDRLRGPAANTRAWLLRWTGRQAEADEFNHIAVEATYRGEPMHEAIYAGWLDLADGRLLAGDLDAAAEIETRLSSLDTSTATMAWYQRHRLGLLRASLAIAANDQDTAAELALAVIGDATERGARRHAAIASVSAGLAGALPPDALEPVVGELTAFAGLEGWRSVAMLAEQFDIDPWRAEARTRAAALVVACGDAREAAQRFVGRTLS